MQAGQYRQRQRKYLLALPLGGKVWPKPLFRFRYSPIFTGGIVFHLILVYATQVEIVCFRVGEIETANRGPRIHRPRFRQLNASRLFRIQNVPQRVLLGVVGLAGVA